MSWVVEEVLAELGGVADRATLLARVTEASLRRALREGRIVRLARGRYALPAAQDRPTGWEESARRTAEAGRRAAHETHGVAVLLSAAGRWGWQMKWTPSRPQVAVPRGRRVSAEVQKRMQVHWRTIPRGDLDDGWVTDRVRTAIDCASMLSPDQALCVLDSALREGHVGRDELLLAAGGLAPRFRAPAERVIRLADPRAANPFESVLRWITSDICGLTVVPQVRIDDSAGFVSVVDLADEELRLVLEADSYEHHSSPEQLERDCVRYTRLVADDWLVLRFTWKQVMNRPEWVRSMIERAVEIRAAQRALAARTTVALV